MASLDVMPSPVASKRVKRTARLCCFQWVELWAITGFLQTPTGLTLQKYCGILLEVAHPPRDPLTMLSLMDLTWISKTTTKWVQLPLATLCVHGSPRTHPSNTTFRQLHSAPTQTSLSGTSLLALTLILPLFSFTITTAAWVQTSTLTPGNCMPQEPHPTRVSSFTWGWLAHLRRQDLDTLMQVPSSSICPRFRAEHPLEVSPSGMPRRRSPTSTATESTSLRK